MYDLKHFKADLYEIHMLLEAGRLDLAIPRLAVAGGRYGDHVARSDDGLEHCFMVLDDLIARAAADLCEPGAALSNITSSGRGDGNPCIYLTSRIYRDGGHTSVIEDLMRARPAARHIIYVTMPLNDEELLEVRSRVGAFQLLTGCDVDLRLVALDREGHVDEIVSLVKDVAKLDFRALYLFHHPDDVLPPLAAACLSRCSAGDGAGNEQRFCVYHHSDYRPTVGLRLAGFDYIGFKPAQAATNRPRLHSSQWAHVLPLAVDRPGDGKTKSATARSKGRPSITATCGAPHKLFAPLAAPAFFETIADVLTATGGEHYHIGPLGDGEIAHAKTVLARRNVDPKRLHLAGRVSNLARKLIEHDVDVYISSFPIGGGRSCVEAMSLGLPIATFVNEAFPQAGDADICYPEAIRWTTSDDLCAQLARLDDKALAAHRAFSAQHFDRHHTREALAHALKEMHNEASPAGVESNDDIPEEAVDRLCEFVEQTGVNADIADDGSIADNLTYAFDGFYYRLFELDDVRYWNAPLAHYLLHGIDRQAKPHPLIDPVWMGQRYGLPDGTDPLPVVLRERPFVSGDPLFDEAWYLDQHADIREGGVAPFTHYLLFGHKENRKLNPCFDAAYYREQADLPKIADFDWLVHYKVVGSRKDLNPHPFFDAAYYRNRYARAGSVFPDLPERFGPLGHFLAAGLQKNHNPHPLINMEHLAAETRMMRRPDEHPFVFYLRQPNDTGIDPHPLFCAHYYLINYPDIRDGGIHPLKHFIAAGYLENRLPGAFFEPGSYYRRHMEPDKETGNPLVHFLEHGFARGAAVKPVDPLVRQNIQTVAKAMFGLDDMRAGIDCLRQSTGLLGDQVTSIAFAPVTIKTISPDGDGEDVWLSKPRIYSPQHVAAPCGFASLPATALREFVSVEVFGASSGILTDGRDFHCDGEAQSLHGQEPGSVIRHAGQDRAVAGWLNLPHPMVREAYHLLGEHSRDYIRFLITILPRALRLCDGDFSPSMPALIDAHLPDRSIDALRAICGPDRRLFELGAHHVLRVGMLHYDAPRSRVGPPGSQARGTGESVLDTGQLAEVRRRLLAHVETCRPNMRSPHGPWIFIDSQPKARRLLNQDEIRDKLTRLGFRAVRPGEISFAEQVEAFRDAQIIIGPHSDDMANLLFAAPSARIYVLASGASGYDYQTLHQIAHAAGGAMNWVLGHMVRGTAPEEGSIIDSDYVVMWPFLEQLLESNDGFPLSDKSDPFDALLRQARSCYSQIGSWQLLAEPAGAAFWNRLGDCREAASVQLKRLFDDSQSGDLPDGEHGDSPAAWTAAVSHEVFGEFPLRVVSGWSSLELSAKEQELADQACAALREAKDDCRLLDHAVRQLFLLSPSYRIPLVGAPEAMSPDTFELYLSMLLAEPYLFREGEEQDHLDFLERLMSWWNSQVARTMPPEQRAILAAATQRLSLSQLYVLDGPRDGVLDERRRLIDTLKTLHKQKNADAGPPHAMPKTDAAPGRKFRVGILCRTFKRGPDSECIYAQFQKLDTSRFELYAYTIDFADRVVKDDPAFSRKFSRLFSDMKVLPNRARDMVERVREDRLDIFLLANATTFGVQDIDIMLSHRLAPIQAVMNNINPGRTALESFDYYITARSDDPAADVELGGDVGERLAFIDHVPICYLERPETYSDPSFRREQLAIPDDAVVFYNAGAAAKLRFRCLDAMMRIIKRVPKSVLLLAPFNPGWAGRHHAYPLERQLGYMCQRHGIERERIICMSEMTVAEAHQIIDLIDIYLAPFPHGGATTTTMVLERGKPVVVKRRETTQSIDQFLVASLGVGGMLASTVDDYVETACRLAGDDELRRDIGERIGAEMTRAPFYDRDTHSTKLQELLERLIAENSA